MNKIKNVFGISMAMFMISGITLSLTACTDQVPLAPSNLEAQPTYGENKIVDEELPATDVETFLRLGIDYDDGGE